MRVSLIIMITIIMIMMKGFSECCLESEKIGLLQIKDKFKFEDSIWGWNSDCCSWFGVECNSSTGHVSFIDLSHITYYNSSEEWYLNVSLFLPFPHLYQLDLSSTGIAGFEGVSSTLTNLEILDLSENNFNNTIFQSLSALPSLKSLNLGYNRLNGTVNNKYSGFERLSTLTNLEILDLSGNNLNNSTSILQLLSALPSLKSLSLNSLNGTFNISGFERVSSTLTNLEILDLSENNFNNTIFQSLSALPSLKSLNLGYNRLNGTFNISDLDGFPNLQELDLSGNEITEFVVSKDYRGPSNLSTLHLDFMRAIFDGKSTHILQSLAKLPNIKTLSLIDNNFQGHIFVEVQHYDYKSKVEEVLLDYSSIDENFLGKLSRAFPSLKRLSMTQLNNISGTLAIREGSIFESLEHLYLNGSALHINWLQRIGTMRSLKTLSMPSCGLSGDIPASQGLCMLKNLQELDLSNNDLTGNLPWCLGNLTSLEMLDLSDNQLSGNLPLSLANWTSIQRLDLSNNLLQIPISLTPLFNLSQLTFLDVYKNTIYADTHDPNLIPKFQLERLSLIGYGDVGEMPKFLYYQHNLYKVVISNIKLRGMFPYWLLENNTRLHTLDVFNNSLSGPLLLPNKPHLNLTILDISDNNFNGSIPSQIGVYFPSLNYLYMSRNEFKGSIPNSLCNSSHLHFLDMSQNNISGSIPKCIGNMTQLELLDLSKNNISGSIPKCIGNMTQLGVLDLSNNIISGCLPNFSSTFIQVVKLSKNRLHGSLNDAFYYCSSLIVLDLSHNNFSRSVPSWIGRLSQLSYFVLGHNNLQGEIPIELCNLKQLNFLDVSHNKFSSHMISCLSFIGHPIFGETVTLEFTVKGNTYSYRIELSSYISGIDISCNNLRGQIPLQIGDLRNIKVLNFSHNSFTGRIPPTFANLTEIESLDLSYNNLQGTIPRQLTQLNGLAVFNVSYNNLSGQTPDHVKQFGTFEESSYKGNPFLCGWPLPKSCNEIDSTQSSSYNEESNDSLIDMETFYWSFGVAYGMVLISIVVILCINPHWRRVWFYYVQISMDSSYYFLIDNVPFLSSFKFPKFCRRIYRCVRD